MDTKTLFAKSISLLYRESQIEDNNNSKDLVSEVIGTLKINGNDISGTDNHLNEIKDIIVDMTEREVGQPYNELMQHLKLACGQNHEYLYDSIRDNIMFEMPPEELKKTILSLRYDLNKYLKNKKAMDLLDRITYEVKFKKDSIPDLDSYLNTNLNKVTEMVNYAGEEIPGIVIELDLSDEEAVAEQFALIQAEADGSRVLKTPWQAMNRMTRGGIRLGQLTTVGGLAHNNKTGVCLSIFAAACMFNNPDNLLVDRTKKPLNLLISFEDDAQIVLSNLYSLLKGNIDNIEVSDEDKAKLDKREAASYVRRHLESTGYNIKILRINPSDWSYLEIQNQILLLESQGYEIHMCLIDYLRLANMNGLSNVRLDSDIQELFRRTKNFMCAGRNIALVTPAQLATELYELKKQGNKMLVQTAADGSVYADCRGLSREPELEIFVDIVKDNGVKYQAFARGKHRGQNNTPEEHKFFLLPFAKVGGLRWDINGTDTSLSRFGATRDDSGNEEFAFYDIG